MKTMDTIVLSGAIRNVLRAAIPLWARRLAIFTALTASAGLHAQAVRGTMDLRSWNAQASEALLDGEWEFYWGQFLDPSQTPALTPAVIQVPSQWQEQTDPSGNKYPAHGFATYRLKVLLPEKHPPLSIAMNDAGMAYELYINGRLHSTNGKVGRTKDEMILHQQYRTFPVHIDNAQELVIVVHVSNFHYYKAGLWQSARLGSSAQIEADAKEHFAMDLVVVSSLMIMGLYHLGLFANRRKDRSTLFFGLFCISVALRTLSIKERMIYDAVPWLSFEIIHRIEFISFFLGSFLFLRFIDALFPGEYNKKIRAAFDTVFLASSALVLLFPMNIYTRVLLIVQVGILAGIAYTVFVLILAARRKRLGPIPFLAGLSIFFGSVIHDILRTRGFVHTPFMASYGLIFLVVSQAVVLSRRFANAFVDAENLGEELRAFSRDLEQKVETRTIELNRALKVISNDMAYAKRIQQDVLQADTTFAQDLDIHVLYEPMIDVGGDFYGITAQAPGRYRVLLADVTGHGVQAALITMAVKGIYDNVKNFELPPSDVLGILNREFIERYISLNSLLTCILVDLDLNANTLTYASAGHPPAILVSEDRLLFLEKTGRLIGVEKGFRYATKTVSFFPGDRLYLVTDGIYEQFNNAKNDFGETRVHRILASGTHKTPRSVVEELYAELTTFLGGEARQDDVTVVAIHRPAVK